ncbi:copper resistance protein C [Deinococcus xinjiangensis]|uniref:Copper resistance protein C n=1 Tax=Deinococcus xinjiangensis TaxID=457454 RepID=A0ABP9V659_9DEIO
MKKYLMLALLLGGFASAHTQITSLSPAAGATVTAPKTVTLTLSEAVDQKFVTIKVYPIKAAGDLLTLNRAAAALAKTALGSKNDASARVDMAQPKSGMAQTLSVPLKPLKAGTYAIMWRLLSDDGHVVSGQSVFKVK